MSARPLSPAEGSFAGSKSVQSTPPDQSSSTTAADAAPPAQAALSTGPDAAAPVADTPPAPLVQLEVSTPPGGTTEDRSTTGSEPPSEGDAGDFARVGLSASLLSLVEVTAEDAQPPSEPPAHGAARSHFWRSGSPRT